MTATAPPLPPPLVDPFRRVATAGLVISFIIATGFAVLLVVVVAAEAERELDLLAAVDCGTTHRGEAWVTVTYDAGDIDCQEEIRGAFRAAGFSGRAIRHAEITGESVTAGGYELLWITLPATGDRQAALVLR